MIARLFWKRIRLVSSYRRHFRISATDVECKIDNGAGGSRATWAGKPERVGERGREPINGVGVWRGKIQIESDGAELMTVVKQRVNSLSAPFQFEWRHVSHKLWDRKLVRVGNPELEMPSGIE